MRVESVTEGLVNKFEHVLSAFEENKQEYPDSFGASGLVEQLGF